MHTTRVMKAMLLVMLVLVSCDSKDEPSHGPAPATPGIVLVCTDNTIYNLDGDTVFQTIKTGLPPMYV